MNRDDAIFHHLTKVMRSNDPDMMANHEAWLIENRRQNRECPHKEKTVSQATIDSIHAWAAANPDKVPS